MPAMSLKDDFDAAVARVNGLSQKPSNEVLLDLYGLFKQATAGDAGGGRPGAFDFKARAKYDAWAGRKGLSADAAMQAYIDTASKLS
jgi:diazepam-binding inhibitor (GABA receptor modulating acyl-CoA-binding protein)